MVIIKHFAVKFIKVYHTASFRQPYYLFKIRQSSTLNEILMQHLSILYADFEQPISNINVDQKLVQEIVVFVTPNYK